MTTQTEAQRLIEWIEGDMSCTGDKEIVAELRRLEAANAELLESLAGVLKIGRGSSDRIIIEGLQEEAMHAAIAKHGGAA